MSALVRLLVLRLLTGAVVVVAVVVATWLTLFWLRPAVIDDGTGLLPQLSGYLGRAFLHLDLGVADLPGDPRVVDLIRETVPADLSLLLGGVVTGTVLGVGGGALAAIHPRSLPVRVAETLAFLAFAAPVFVVGLTLLLLFGAEIGAVSTVPGIPLEYVPFRSDPLAWFGSLLVPWVVLSLPLAGLCFRLMSGMTVEALEAPYVRTARAKGLSRRAAVLRHAAPSGALPALTLAGAATNMTIINLALLEPVFGVPGILRTFTRVLGTTDVPLLLGITLVAAVLVVGLNLVFDLIVRAIDPALRKSSH